MPIISALMGQRQEDHRFEAILDSIARVTQLDTQTYQRLGMLLSGGSAWLRLNFQNCYVNKLYKKMCMVYMQMLYITLHIRVWIICRFRCL